MARLVRVDSAGTHVVSPGHRVDERARKVALAMGVELKKRRSRQVKSADFQRFDFIFAMDQDNFRDLLAICPEEQANKLALISSFIDKPELTDIPDPYYGSFRGFERVYDLLEEGVSGLVEQLRIKMGI